MIKKSIRGAKEFTLKPMLIFWIVALSTIPISLFATFFIGMFSFMFLAKAIGLKITASNILIFGALLFVLLEILFVWLAYARARKMKFSLLKDRIEYYEGLFTVEKKVVYYNQITNVGLRKGVFEKRYGLGSIFVDTAGSSRKGHELTISSVEEPDKWYNWISKKVKLKRG